MKSDELNEWNTDPVPAIKDRELCYLCKKVLAIELRRQNDEALDLNTRIQLVKNFGSTNGARGQVSGWRYRSHGHFCTYLCCEIFANGIVDKIK